VTKLKLKQTVTKDVEIEVPEHFFHDHSVLGAIVDDLIAVDERTQRKYGDVRARLYSDDINTVKCAISQIEDAYVLAIKIVGTLQRFGAKLPDLLRTEVGP
jgi:hypothetical protein